MKTKEQEVCKALGNKANMYFAFNDVLGSKAVFAENSQFYNEVMADGNIFNPYIHRRWLPAKYSSEKRLLKNSETIKNKVCKFTVRYFAELAHKEIGKLCLLYKYNRSAYFERANFFTLDILKMFALELLHSKKDHIEWTVEHNSAYAYRNSTMYVCEIGYLDLEEKCVLDEENGGLKQIKYPVGYMENLEECIDLIENRCNSIMQLKEIIDREPFWVRYNWTKIAPLSSSEKLVEAYDKSGRYYTLKHYLMFEGAEYKGCTGTDALNKLTRELMEGVFYNDESERELDRILGIQ